MSEAILIFQHMRGGCATVGNTVHALFRVNGRRPGLTSRPVVGAVELKNTDNDPQMSVHFRLANPQVAQSSDKRAGDL